MEVTGVCAMTWNCEGYTTPITRIPFRGGIRDDGNHNNIDNLQYKSLGMKHDQI